MKRDHALTSGTIKAMLSGPGQFAENETNEVLSNFIIAVIYDGHLFRRLTFARSHLMYFRKCVCISHTRPATPTAPPRFPSFQFPQRLPWSSLWQLTSWTADFLLILAPFCLRKILKQSNNLAFEEFYCTRPSYIFYK